MKCYYAHPVSLYSDHSREGGAINQQEVRDLTLLNALGFEVSNPNDPVHDHGYRSRGMEYFQSLVLAADVLAFRAFPDGSIPAGIAKEIQYARDGGKMVIELPSAIARRTLSVEATRETLKEVGTR